MSEQGQHAQRLLREGRLQDAIAATQDEVRRRPADAAARYRLAELLSIAGNLPRADILLDALSAVEPAMAAVVAEFRQLIRAALAREQLFSEGRLPEFLSAPTQAQQALLAAVIALRDGNPSEALRAAETAEAARPRLPGRHAETAFDDMRDADDLFAGTFEVLTSTGKYYWVPAEHVASIEFHAPARPRDLLWRRASMSVRDGPEGDVYVPAIYPATGSMTEALLLGRETSWTGGDEGPARGVGQRMFLMGEEAIGIMELATLTFSA